MRKDSVVSCVYLKRVFYEGTYGVFLPFLLLTFEEEVLSQYLCSPNSHLYSFP